MNVSTLVVEHYDWIRTKASHYYANASDAEDLASDTICKCLEYGARFDTSRDFKPWAAVIMENTYKTQYRRRQCVGFAPLGERDDFCAHNRSDHSAMLDDALVAIRRCKEQSVCVESTLLYAKGYNYEEIADIEGVGVGTVKSRIRAARSMLAEALSR